MKYILKYLQFNFSHSFPNFLNRTSVVLCQISDEPCDHPIVIHGLCSECGIDVSTQSQMIGNSSNPLLEDKSAREYTTDLGFLTKGTEISVCKKVWIDAKLWEIMLSLLL